MSRSPYGQGAAIEILHEAPRAAAARMPLAPNAGAQESVHPGAVAGLIDTCGAFSSYMDPGVGFDRSGATVAMSVSYLATVAGDLDGYSRLIARTGSVFANHVQAWGRESGVLAATGMVSYRIAGG
jgi:acyl-coenzyme A thioesterase PaaI-like protein